RLRYFAPPAKAGASALCTTFPKALSFAFTLAKSTTRRRPCATAPNWGTNNRPSWTSSRSCRWRRRASSDSPENRRIGVRFNSSSASGPCGPSHQLVRASRTRYVMDAKQRGNLAGATCNHHSCEPNCRVQSVFVKTHDPRFPETAFFALRRISAGEELCWDYSYEVGSVPGKELICYCLNTQL
uniref:SET domain-containing protein n=1 Tax=Macrostomum lignano TaxID=282301 RepID=A0A1I8IY46_9PLAT